MATQMTNRLGLSYQDPNDVMDIGVYNGNMPTLDAFAGAKLVNPGIIPPDSQLYDGCIVKEKITGIVWVAEWNGSGYNQRFICYPWLMIATNSNVTTPYQAVCQTAGSGTNTFKLSRNSGYNSSSTDIDSNGRVKAPVKGIYQISGRVTWGFSDAGNNALFGYGHIDLQINGTGLNHANFQTGLGGDSDGLATQYATFQPLVLNAGDTVGLNIRNHLSTSPNAINGVDVNLAVVLNCPAA